MLPVTSLEDRRFLEPVLALPTEHSSVLNIVLHAIYNISCRHYSPSFDTLVDAVGALKTYGVNPKNFITTSTPLYDVLLTHAISRPLDLFALASLHNLDDLAVATSSHLVSFSLCTINDSMAERIGPIYLKRLFFMHLGRAEALRNILLPPPYPHTPTAACDHNQQKHLTRAWTLSSAYLAWDGRAGASEFVQWLHRTIEQTFSSDLSVRAIRSALMPLGDHLSCELCRAGLNERIESLVKCWSMIKVRHFQ
jgi:hypothetical protein